MGSKHVLAPNRPQAVTFTNRGHIWRDITSQGIQEVIQFKCVTITLKRQSYPCSESSNDPQEKASLTNAGHPSRTSGGPPEQTAQGPTCAYVFEHKT